MGYRRSQKTLKLTFVEGELQGLEVRVRRASPELMRHVIAVAENTGKGTIEEQGRRVLDLCEAFGNLIDSWNYEDENGNPIPATAEALNAEDAAFVIALAYGWIDAMAERAEQMRAAAEPGDAAAEPAGDVVAEADLPMEALN